MSVRRQTLENVKRMIEMKRSVDYQKCVELARHHFEDNFNHNIQNLTHMFPADHKTTEGTAFWSGPKRFPLQADYGT